MDQKALIEAYKAAEKALLESQRTDFLYGVREGAPPIAPWPTEPCKLVFLDFDGVLNCEVSVCQLGTRYKFWPESINALNELLAESGARVVGGVGPEWPLVKVASFCGVSSRVVF